MKKIFVLIGALLTIIGHLYSQLPENSIKKIAFEYMIEREELHPRVDIHDPSDISLSVYDYKNKVDIIDPTIVIPTTDTLSFYKIQSLDAHTNMHFMFTKNGEWKIISMGGRLPYVMNKGVELCETLKLDFYESLYVFKKILQYKEMYYQDNHDDVIIE